MTAANVLAHSESADEASGERPRSHAPLVSEKLALEPVEARPGGLRYRCGTTYFVVFQSTGKASGESTQMAWEVDDIEAVVADLRSGASSSKRSTYPA